MKTFVIAFALLCVTQAEEIRLLDLEPTDAQQYIDKQDTTLKYAPKIESNVPAVRFLGNEPHNVVEDIYLANQYHGQDGLGGYLYGYSVPDIAKTEKKKAGGDLRGAYNYISGDGQEIKVEYWDDGTGFHQIDNVPKIQPKQIEDTPEVKAAKDEHLRIWQEQAERNSKPIANPYDGAGNYAQGPLSLQGQQQFKQNQQFQQPQYQQSQFNQGTQYQQPKQQTQFNQGGQQYQFKQPQQQTSTLVNQYQQQKQHFPNPGQSVQYQGTQAGQYYQGQPSQTVNQYQAQATSGVTQPKQVYLPQQQNPNQYQAQATQLNHGQAAVGVNQPKQVYLPQQNQYQGAAGVNQPKQVYLPQQNNYQAQATNVQSTQAVHQSQYGQGQSGEDDGQYRAGPEEEQGPPKGFFYNFDYPVGIIVSKDGGIQKRESDLKNVYSTNKANFEKQLQGQGGSRPARSSTGYLYIPH